MDAKVIKNMEYPIEIKGKTIKQVKKLNLSGKNLKVIPQNVYQYTNLEKLDLSNNRIETIPSDILKLRKLRTVMENERKNKIFISYSHADIEYYKKLTTHLKVLQNYFDLEVCRINSCRGTLEARNS